ncbi:MAG: GIVxVP protein [Cyanobacteriota bacterium]|jgi:hypothetical protein|nr:GIVxVP protein [Cyanobacteriota bacterium]
MSVNRVAKGIVLVPSLLLGGAFLSAAAWMDGPAAQNKGLALALGGVLLAGGLLAQWLPSDTKPADPDPSDPGSAKPSATPPNPRSAHTNSQRP